MISTALRRRRLIVAAMLLSILGSATATELEFTALPDWVVDRAFTSGPPETPNPASGPVRVLAEELQVRFRQDGADTFFRSAMTANTPSGVEEISNVSLAYIPAHQNYVIHYIRVHRDGALVDVADRIETRFLRQDVAAAGPLDELQTIMSLLIGGVEQGDTIEFAATLNSDDPAFDGVIEGTHHYGLNDADDVYHRLLIPSNRQLYLRSHAGYPEPQIEEGEQFTEYRWTIGRVSAVTMEDNTPVWYASFPLLEYSSHQDWGDVGRWARSKLLLNPSPSKLVVDTAREIDDANASIEDKIAATLAFVQSKVRYVGPGIGRNGHRPFPPETVLRRLYGDCKDKTTLMRALLAEMGIQSWPALVNTLGEKVLARRLPSISAFDHVILFVDAGAASYWLDPTEPAPVADKSSLSPAHWFGRALVVKAGETALSVIAKPADYAQSEFAHYESSIDLSAGNANPVPMTRRWHLVGPAARGIRETRQSAGTSAFSEIVHKYNMRGERDNTPVGEARLLDGDNSQGVTVEAEYTLTEPLRIRSGSSSLSYTHTAIHLIDQLPVPPAGPRKAPYAIPFPAQVKDTLTIDVGSHYFTPDRIERTVDDPHFRFSNQVHWQDGKLTFEYELTMKKDHVLPEAYDVFRANVKRAHRGMVSGVSLDGDVWPVPTATKADVDRGMTLDFAVDMFNYSNRREGKGTGQPALTAAEVTRAIRQWDRTKYPVSDDIYEIFQHVAETQKLPLSLKLLPFDTSYDLQLRQIRIWHITLCSEVHFPDSDEQAPLYCRDIRNVEFGDT